jgi:hypothetical protein
MEMKILLCYPPLVDNYDYPMLGIPSLMGYLKMKEKNVMQWDLNIAFREFIRSNTSVTSFSKVALSFVPNNALLSYLSVEYLQKTSKRKYYSKYIDPKFSSSFWRRVTV